MLLLESVVGAATSKAKLNPVTTPRGATTLHLLPRLFCFSFYCNSFLWRNFTKIRWNSFYLTLFFLVSRKSSLPFFSVSKLTQALSFSLSPRQCLVPRASNYVLFSRIFLKTNFKKVTAYLFSPLLYASLTRFYFHPEDSENPRELLYVYSQISTLRETSDISEQRQNRKK